MHTDFLRKVFVDLASDDAIIWNDQVHNYKWLTDRIDYWSNELSSAQIAPGTVVAIDGDYSPNGIALFLALIERSCVLVPLTSAVKAKHAEFIGVSQGEFTIAINDQDQVTIERLERQADHELYRKLRSEGHPGLVLFSSGSTGESKATVHDCVRLLKKFNKKRAPLRTIAFLLYDHIGGINTLFHTLSSGGCLITLPRRTPEEALRAIERHRVELLPASPTFLNLLLLGEQHERFDLSSLKIISYGTEPMPEITLQKLHQVFPEVRLHQLYGLSEVGILGSKSRGSDSVWVKIGGKGIETRVVDNILHIKAESAMLGYLNAQEPITEDGWLNTGDIVEVDGEHLRFRGRDSELINVGGEKVYPAEVENVLIEMNNVVNAVVYGEPNPITGTIVVVDVALADPEDRVDFTKRLKKYCGAQLESFKIPVKVNIVSEPLHSERFKKTRRKPAKGNGA